MIRVAVEGFGTPVSLRSEHGLVYGQLDTQPGSAGLVVLAHAAETPDAHAPRLAGHFRRFGLSTLSIELLSHREERYADVHHNVPLLARRLLEFLALIKERVGHGELAAQPIGLYGADYASPVVVRVAALRDHDVAAVVCRGGLIDLAGVLYLHTLASPLLLLAEGGDETHTASNRRALREVRCLHELRLVPAIASDDDASPDFERIVEEAARWFGRHFANFIPAVTAARVEAGAR